MTRRVLPVCLPVNKREDFKGDDVTVAGWGTVQPGGFSLTNELMKVKVPVVNRLVCGEMLRRTEPTSFPRGVIAEQMCAGEKGKDSCQVRQNFISL